MGTRVGDVGRPRVIRWRRLWTEWREDLLACGAFVAVLAVGYAVILMVGAP